MKVNKVQRMKRAQDITIATAITKEILRYQIDKNIKNQCMSNTLVFINLCKDFGVELDIKLASGFVHSILDPRAKEYGCGNELVTTLHMWCMVEGEICELSHELTKIPQKYRIYTYHDVKTYNCLNKQLKERFHYFKALVDKINNAKEKYEAECDYHIELKEYVLSQLPLTPFENRQYRMYFK